MLSATEIASLRARFPIFRHSVYLNSCSQGALSDAVEGSMRGLLESWDRFGSPWDTWVEQYEVLRGEFAAFLGAEADEVAIVPSVSAGVSSVASALEFSRRKTVVMGEYEFPTMGHVWLAQQRRGAQVKFLSAQDGRLAAEQYRKAIDGDTLIVPVTGICFMNGFRSEIGEIVEAAHAKGSYVLLDDYQDCGTRPRKVKELGVDFYTAGALKYLLGAAGIAFLYVRKELIGKLQPSVSGWFAQQNPFAFDTQHFEPASSARRFEAGTPPIPSVYMALAGLRLLREIGMQNVAEQIQLLAQSFLEGARRLGIRSKTPDDTVGPLVVLQAKDAAGLVTTLAKEGIICSSRHDGLRIAFHVYNTTEDVGLVLRALEKHREQLVTDEHAVGARG